MRILSYAREKLSTLRLLLANSRRLLSYAWGKYPGMTAVLGAVAVLTAFGPFVRTGATAHLVNQLVRASGESFAAFVPALAILLAAMAVPSILYDVYRYLDKKFWILMLHDFELEYAKKRSEIDVATHEDPKFNDLETRASDNYYASVNMLSGQFNLAQNLVSLVTASAVLLLFDPLVFGIMFLGVFPSFIVEAKYGKNIWGIHDAKAEERRRFYDLRHRFSRLEELVELKLFNNIKKIFGLMADLLESYNRENIGVERRKFLMKLGATALSIAATGVSIAWVISRTAAGGLEVGTMTFVLATIGAFEGSFSAFLFDIANQIKYSLFVTDIFAVFDTKRTIATPERPVALEATRTPEIIFEKVSFKYPGTDSYVLKDFDLRVAPGDKLAVVGVNGAGKTTLVKLLCRFYDPTEGRVLVGGTDLRELDLEKWYEMLAVLFQDYATYNFIAKETIALGRSSVPLDEARVRAAADASDSRPFIEEWKDKYEQMIGKEFTGGVELSRGQQQKLALARSFYRDPKVLVLDEPTASVDAEAEAKIFDRLESMGREATMIFISHRFSTVRKADRICVIEEGRLSEYGTHAELIANGKTYARLFELQAKGYRE